MSFCSYFDANVCHSCSWIDYFYAEQIKQKEEHLHSLLDPFHPTEWHKSIPSPLKGFRNKAKMTASPSPDGVVLGINEESSLIDCPLYDESMQRTLHTVQTWLRELGIQAYDVRKKKGELKYVLLTRTTSGEMMLRFVLRSHGIIPRLKNGLGDLMERSSALKVVTANIQSVHMAIMEGEEEVFLTSEIRIKESFNAIPLYIRPKSFFQTNPSVAEKLYRTAADWVNDSKPSRVWDLFCGVGGFALHCAAEGREVIGIEIESEAIKCAQDSASEMGIKSLHFESLDAATFGALAGNKPDVVIVNPPRRGLGEQLCKRLSKVLPERIVYSSCNALTLAKDLEMLPSYRLRRVQIVDMFPHTPHYEVLAELTLL